jgi:hypothetical protein
MKQKLYLRDCRREVTSGIRNLYRRRQSIIKRPVALEITERTGLVNLFGVYLLIMMLSLADVS